MSTISSSTITPCLWFDTQGEQAANFYTGIFENSRITDVTRHGPAGPGEEGTVLTVTFELDGQEFVALNGGPQFTFDEAISFQISCANQAEIDYYWEKLVDGGQEGPCGWLKDRYGLSWQVVPSALPELIKDPDPVKSQRAMRAMLGTHGKLDIDAIRNAAEQASEAATPGGQRPFDDRSIAIDRRFSPSLTSVGSLVKGS